MMCRIMVLTALAFVLPATLMPRAARADSAAFQGHAAEMMLRSDEDERRRRALYFDTVDVEIGPQGLPCDHLATRRPETIAGPGFVVLATIAEPARTLSSRVWLLPGAAATADEGIGLARKELAARFPERTVTVTDHRRFLWCR